MTEVQSNEEFEHYHGDGLKNIRLEEARLAEARQNTDLGQLDDALQDTMKGVREKLAGSLERGPEHVFKHAVKSLKEADAKRFIIENALESLKQGNSYADTIARYNELGLLPRPKDGDTPSPPPADIPFQGTLALLERRSIWGRFTTFISQVAVNGLKSVPKWIEIEPQVGFVGPLPTISFTLKGKGMSIHDFFEALSGSET